MSELSVMSFKPVLDPMERISELLFGLIMALTFTVTLGVATADQFQGSNHAVRRAGLQPGLGHHRRRAFICWPVSTIRAQDIDAACHATMHQISHTAQRIIADALPPMLASVVPPEQLELMRQKLQRAARAAGAATTDEARLDRRLGLCLLSFLSTFPIVIPFIFIDEARLALRVSNAVAIVMLCFCGYAFGYRSGLRPWVTGSCNGGHRRRVCRRRNRSWRIRTTCGSGEQLRQAGLGKRQAHKLCLDRCGRRSVACVDDRRFCAR